MWYIDPFECLCTAVVTWHPTDTHVHRIHHPCLSSSSQRRLQSPYQRLVLWLHHICHIVVLDISVVSTATVPIATAHNDSAQFHHRAVDSLPYLWITMLCITRFITIILTMPVTFTVLSFHFVVNILSDVPSLIIFCTRSLTYSLGQCFGDCLSFVYCTFSDLPITSFTSLPCLSWCKFLRPHNWVIYRVGQKMDWQFLRAAGSSLLTV